MKQKKSEKSKFIIDIQYITANDNNTYTIEIQGWSMEIAIAKAIRQGRKQIGNIRVKQVNIKVIRAQRKNKKV